MKRYFLNYYFSKLFQIPTFWKKLKSDLKKFFPYLNFLPLIISLHFLKLCRKNTYLFMCFLQTINFLVLLEYFHLLFYILIIVNYFLLKNLKIVSHWKRAFFPYLRLKNLFLWQIPSHLAFTIILLKMPKIKMKSAFHFHL